MWQIVLGVKIEDLIMHRMVLLGQGKAGLARLLSHSSDLTSTQPCLHNWRNQKGLS